MRIRASFIMAIVAVIMTLLSLPQQAVGQAPGEVCATAIPVDTSYSEIINTPGTYWYTAWTYDLPMRVVFRPFNAASNRAPHAEIDFTCTPGVYENPILQDLFSGHSGTSINMPVNLPFVTEHDSLGHIIYTVSVTEEHRSLLSMVGITEDIQAFVKVDVEETGEVWMTPDNSFRDCIERALILHVGDTVNVLPRDSSTVFIFPFAEWRNDSIRLRWKGMNSEPVRLWMSAAGCNFTPSGFDDNIYDFYTIAHNGYYDYSNEAIRDIVSSTGSSSEDRDGYMYVKLTTTTVGQFFVERIPAPPAPPDPSIELPLGTSIALPAGATGANTVYRLSYAMLYGGALKITWSGSAPCQVYMADTCFFNLTTSSPHYVTTTQRYVNVAARNSVTLDSTEVASWADKTDSRGFIYVRMKSNQAGNIKFESLVFATELHPVAASGTVLVACGDAPGTMYVTVSEEQTLRLVTIAGEEIEKWHQMPSDAMHELTLQRGVVYLLKGKDGTLRIIP